LEFDCLSVKVDGTYLEVDTYRAEVAFRVGILGEPQEQARLNSKNAQRQVRQAQLWQEMHTFPTPESPIRSILKR
jgi:hypothetical protein